MLQWHLRQTRNPEPRPARRRRPALMPADPRRRTFRPGLTGLEARLAPAVNLAVSAPQPVPEGDSGTVDMVFTVTRSGDLAPAVSVDYATRDGTAMAGVDYQARSGTLHFATNQLTATVAVPVIGNTRLQPDRQLALRLSNPRIDGGASTPLAFAAPQSFATATRTFASAAADFNGDGKPDLAVITQSNNSVVVLLNTT